jgi:hypothetical protein
MEIGFANMPVRSCDGVSRAAVCPSMGMDRIWSKAAQSGCPEAQEVATKGTCGESLRVDYSKDRRIFFLQHGLERLRSEELKHSLWPVPA